MEPLKYNPDVSSIPKQPRDKIVAYVLFGILVAWIVFGLIALGFSFVCFGYSGSVLEKIMGVLLAIIFGPFYFIYYFSSGSYCKVMPPTIMI